jgi:hypothetical protein
MNAMPHAFGRRVCAAALAILTLPTTEPYHRA